MAMTWRTFGLAWRSCASGSGRNRRVRRGNSRTPKYGGRIVLRTNHGQSITVLALLAIGLTYGSSHAQQLNMTQILNDPKLLLQHKADVLAGYQHYAEAERKYPAMQKRFAELGDASIANHDALRGRWAALAKQINE